MKLLKGGNNGAFQLYVELCRMKEQMNDFVNKFKIFTEMINN